MMLSKSALVTGATGLVGQHLCRALAQQGVAVVATSLDADGLAALTQTPGVTGKAGDIIDASFVAGLLQSALPEVIFHLAAYGTFGHEKDVARMVEVNINGTRNLLQMSNTAGCRTVITAGSIKEYGTGRTPITEAMPLAPWDDYAVTKSAAGFFCRLAANALRMNITTLRLSPVYGPGDTLTRFVPSAIAAAINATPFTLSVEALVRNFTYVDDVVAAFLKAADKKTDGYTEYNIGGTTAHSFADILEAVERATGQQIKRITVPAHATHDDSWVVDSSQAQRELDWRPTILLPEGIKRTVEWYQAQVIGHT